MTRNFIITYHDRDEWFICPEKFEYSENFHYELLKIEIEENGLYNTYQGENEI